MREIDMFLKNIPMGEKGRIPLILCAKLCRSTIFKNYVKATMKLKRKSANKM